MTEDFEHNRFLCVQNGKMIFGCVNPFCGHGDPALPNRWEIPVETEAIRISVASHRERKITFEIHPKEDIGSFAAGHIVKLVCADNLPACQETFRNFFSGKENREEQP